MLKVDIVNIFLTTKGDEFVILLRGEGDERTLPISIALFQGQHGTAWGLVFAASIISLVPIIAFFVTMQRYFVSGLTTGAFKG